MASIRDIWRKIKAYEKELFALGAILTLGFFIYGIGMLLTLENKHAPVRIEVRDMGERSGAIDGQLGLLIGSINGSKYHFPWCSGAQRIKEENKIWFDSVEAARAVGYTPAGNCPGL